MSGYLSYELVYRLGGGVDIYEKKLFVNSSEFHVRKNGHLLGTYPSLEAAKDSVSY